MKRRFVVGITGLSSDDQTKFVEFLRKEGMGWWHWIDEVWLITSRSESVSAEQIRDYLHGLKTGTRCVVFEIDEDKSWAGFGPNKAPQDMFAWLKTTWKQE
jgi:hypothetical protein